MAGILLVAAGCTSNSTGPKTPVGGLWAANFGNAQTVVQYTTAQLAASTSAAPTIAIGLPAAEDMGVAFDNNGNMWMTTFTNHTIVEYSAAQLKLSGTPTPVVVITVAGAQPAGLAFDGHGNLWVADYATNTVLGFSASQLSSTGSPTPAITISASAGSIQEPVGIAFDASGSLWVANTSNAANSVVKFTSSQLASSGSPTPSVILTATAMSINGPLLIAFDASGDLWVANGNFSQNTVVEFGASQITASGSPTPTVTIGASAGSLANPGGLAFDGSGNLWVSNVGVSNLGSSTIVEFAASQLVSSGTPTPNVTLGGSSLVGPFGLAFQPHASNLPIKG
jgi:sugar lactone lactonase YvrE